MRLKGFEHIGMSDSGEVEVDTKALEAEAEAAKESAASVPGGKSKPIDRRQKLPPKPKIEAGPGDVEMTAAHIEAAREELWMEGNHNPTEQQILDRARAGVFSTMPDEEVAARAIDAVLADEKSAKEIVERTNKGIKDSIAAAEENSRKWEEVDREKQIEQDRKREDEERIESLKAEPRRNEDEPINDAVRAQIERIEQARKREEVRRVEAIEEDRKREEEARVKSLRMPGVLKNLIFRKDEGVARRASAAAEKERIEQERKREEEERVKGAKAAPQKEETKISDALKEIIFGKK